MLKKIWENYRKLKEMPAEEKKQKTFYRGKQISI